MFYNFSCVLVLIHLYLHFLIKVILVLLIYRFPNLKFLIEIILLIIDKGWFIKMRLGQRNVNITRRNLDKMYNSKVKKKL